MALKQILGWHTKEMVGVSNITYPWSMLDRFGLPSFAFGVDGTHIRLSNKPSETELPHGMRPDDFWCRKQVIAI